jgi:hypothetical protein
MGIITLKLSTLAAAASVFALATAFAAQANAADATPGATLEVGLSVAHGSDNGGANVNLVGVTLRGGYQFHPNFGVEAEGSIGVSGDTDPATGVEFTEKYEVGAFVVGYLPISDRFDVLARVGYAQSKLEGKLGAITATDTVNGAAAGVGLRLFPESENNGVRVDYTHYFFNHDSAADAGSITFVHKF